MITKSLKLNLKLVYQLTHTRACMSTLVGEQAQVDWAHFGHVMLARGRRALSCFVITLSYSLRFVKLFAPEPHVHDHAL
jgi:hypothetical protein